MPAGVQAGFSSFVPTWGPRSGHTFYLPPAYGAVDVGGTLDTSSLTRLDQRGGSFDQRGTQPFFPTEGQITHNAEIHQQFLIDSAGVYHPGQAYPTGIAGVRTAWIDTVQCCLMGGDGTLTWVLPAGTLDPADGSSITNWTAKAKCGGAYNVHWEVGGDYCSFTLLWYIKSGLVRFSNGRLMLVC